jgi:uncharacterized YigZ family protein
MQTRDKRMTVSSPYSVPSADARAEIEVIHSRFIASAARATTTDEAKQFLAAIRAEMPDASHHVFAFRVGHGNSVIDGMSDDGEPSGTAGPPVLAVLRGTQLGDVIVVVTRYFGGTKLGTGGLVRAYSDAARAVLAILPVELKIERRMLGLELPYPFYEQTKHLISAYKGMIEDETFAGDITVLALFPVSAIPAFTHALTELTAGRVQPVEL